jgi:hypothetical protein
MKVNAKKLMNAIVGNKPREVKKLMQALIAGKTTNILAEKKKEVAETIALPKKKVKE